MTSRGSDDGVKSELLAKQDCITQGQNDNRVVINIDNIAVNFLDAFLQDALVLKGSCDPVVIHNEVWEVIEWYSLHTIDTTKPFCLFWRHDCRCDYGQEETFRFFKIVTYR